MRLYIDACCIIYAIEGLPQFKDPVLKRLVDVESRPDGALLTSRLSRLECRTKPLREKQQDILGYYDGFFARPPLVLAEISAAVIERATELRAAHGFKTPDAIHSATAIEEKADAFLTGDVALTRCSAVASNWYKIWSCCAHHLFQLAFFCSFDLPPPSPPKTSSPSTTTAPGAGIRTRASFTIRPTTRS